MSMQQTAKVRENAEMARSLRGAPFPPAVIDRICELQKDRPDLNWVIKSGKYLVRNLKFFRKFSYLYTIVLYDKNGRRFCYSNKARPIRKKEVFIGISISEKHHRATVYGYFPYE